MSAAAGGVVSARIYGPRNLPNEFHRAKRKEEIDPVLAKIETICHRAELDADVKSSGCSSYCLGTPILAKIKTTTIDGRAKHDEDDAQGCYCCLGLLDPTTNIRVNSAIFKGVDAAAAAPPGPGDKSMAQRSLDGLVAFLTCLFPYLPDAEAITYLDAADVDPLIAALLVISRRGWTRRFAYCSPTTVAAVETALRCAAVAAQHPAPQLFVQGWKRVVSHGIAEFASGLSGQRCPDDGNAMNSVRTSLLVQASHQPDDVERELELEESWELARRRLAHGRAVPIGRALPPVRAAMKRMLLAKIHGFYLKALCSLPKDKLTKRYHRGLVMSGHCYGPLQPAASIIVNTVWYEQTFPIPASSGFETTMISTGFLWQMAARSLYGLVSFMCTRYPSLTPDHALQRLLVAEANLQVADPNLFDAIPKKNHLFHTTPIDLELDWSDCPQIGSGKDSAVYIQKTAVRKATVNVPEAYIAAATAAFHPSPPAQKEFLGSPDSVRMLKAVSEVIRLDDGHQLSEDEFDLLCTQLLRCNSSVGMSHQLQKEPEPIEASRSEYAEVSRRVGKFWNLHDRVRGMVVAALEKFNRTDGSQYNLDVLWCQ